MSLYEIHHRTRYAYSEDVPRSYHCGWLVPRDTPLQRSSLYTLNIAPTPRCEIEHVDHFGNRWRYFEIDRPHRDLTVEAGFRVETELHAADRLADSPPWGQAALAPRNDPSYLEESEFVLASPLVPLAQELATYARQSFAADVPLLTGIRHILARIRQDFIFDPRATTIATPLLDVLHGRRGVCQDFAHLTIGCLRSLGMAARYVSGYIETIAQPGEDRLQGADASHAWVSVFCPGIGWIDIDPTNELLPAGAHITMAWGRDYGDVSPLKGVIYGGGEQVLEVAVDVRRLEPAES